MSDRDSSGSSVSRSPRRSQEAFTSTQQQRSRPGPSTFSRAPKGKACLNCRRRKLKCDCAHPVCSQCIRLGREKDCEYTEKDKRSRTEILEENIAVLQARLRKLEHADASPASGSNHSASFQGGAGEDADMVEHDSTYSSAAQSSPDHMRQSPPASFSRSVAQRLIEAFLPHATDLGFFLNTTRFLRWASQHLPPQSSSQSSPPVVQDNDPLLSVIYLWGATLTPDADLRADDSGYLTDAVQRISTAFQPTNYLLLRVALGFNVDALRPKIIHVLQAEVLLANFFYYEGRFVEARQHTANAVSLALSCGLHQLRPSTAPQSPLQDVSTLRLVRTAELATELPPPTDLVDEGEYISAFWQVYVLDKTWAHLSGVPSLLASDGSPNTRIDTPWPLAMEHYANGTIPHEYGHHGRTIEQLFANPTNVHIEPALSALALRAQAVSLFDKAVWLASICTSDPALLVVHQSDFNSLDTLIENFLLALPSVSTFQNTAPPPPPELVRSLATTHMLARTACAKLHISYADEKVESQAKCLSACKATIGAVSCIDGTQLGIVDPIMLVLLTAPAHMIINEIVRVKDIPMYQQPSVSCGNPYYLSRVVGEVVTIMSMMNPASRINTLQLEAVQNMRSVLAGTDFA